MDDTGSTLIHTQWFEGKFLPYLSKWEKSVDQHPGFSKAEDKRMLLSAETLHGIRMTGDNDTAVISVKVYFIVRFYTVLSFVAMVCYLFILPGIKVFLSERLCQNPLETFFGFQRQRGGVSKNQMLKNSETIPRPWKWWTLQHKMLSVHGNCSDIKVATL